jgi:DedD protein
MDQGLKERLVGAAVLIAVAVWLIPWVLDGPEAPLETNGRSLQLPATEEPMPMRTQTLRLGDAAESATEGVPTAAPLVIETATVDPPAAPEGESQAGAGAGSGETQAVAAARTELERAAPPAAQPAPATTTAPPKPAPAVASGDWIVQLGSFGEQANARRVAQRAGTFGYKAEVSSVKSGGRTLYRVRVGPQKTRAEADAAASALRAHGINDARVVAAR